MNRNTNDFQGREVWRQRAIDIIGDEHLSRRLIVPFFEVVTFQERQGWYGACHADTAILYVLARELGLTNVKPIIGEAAYQSFPFDHSWLDVNGQVWDAALYRPLPSAEHLPVCGPVVANIDLATGQMAPITYGSHWRSEYRYHAKQVLSLSFVGYMSNYQYYNNGLWGVVKDIGEKLGLHLNIGRLKRQCTDVEWTELRK